MCVCVCMVQIGDNAYEDFSYNSERHIHMKISHICVCAHCVRDGTSVVLCVHYESECIEMFCEFY